MSTVFLASIPAWASAVAAAGIVGGRRRAIFAGVLLGIYTLVATTLAGYVGPLLPLFVYLHATVYVSFVLLARGRMPPLAYRVLVSWPASWFLASTMLAFPWAIAAALGLRPVGFLVPYAVAVFGFVDTFLPDEGRSTSRSAGRLAPASAAHRVFVETRIAIRGRSDSCRSPTRIWALHVGRSATPHLRARRRRPPGSRASDGRLSDDRVAAGRHASRPGAGSAGAASRALLRVLRQPRSRSAGARARGVGVCGRHAVGRCDHPRRDGRRPRRDPRLRFSPTGDQGPRRNNQRASPAQRRAPDRASPRSGCVPSPAGRGGRPRPVGAHAWWPVGAALVWSAAHDRLGPHERARSRALGSRGDQLYVHRGTGHYGFPLRLGVPPEESVLEVRREGAH